MKFISAAVFSLILCSCTTSYLLQQGYGQWKVLVGSKPIEEVLQNPEISDVAKQKIVYITEVAAFGEKHLNLNRGENYSTYFDTNDKPISYFLFACPKTSLTPMVWSFPVIGQIPYLGFFDFEEAKAKEQQLQAGGLDTYLGTVWAYSTLGWFRDPIFSSMLKSDEVTLARSILHEMVHATIFRPGEAAFNESLASFVGDKGAEIFLEYRYGMGSKAVKRLQEQIVFEEVFDSWVSKLEARLQKLYASELSEKEKIQQREEIFEDEKQQLAQEYASDAGNPFQKILEEEWNNALLLSWRTYRMDREVFEETFYGYAGGNLRRFLRYLKDMPAGRDALGFLRSVIVRRGARTEWSLY